MDPLKVALASDWFYPKIGGIETHIHELALTLQRMGHEPHVFTHDYRAFGPYRDSFPYPVHRLRGRFYIKSAHVSLGPGALMEANNIYKKVGFDITHVHSIYSPLAVAMANLSRGIRGVPVVATNHSLFLWRRATLPLVYVIRHFLRRVDAFIAVSRKVAEDSRRLLRLDGHPLYIVPNAVDPSFWRPAEDEERARARRALGIPEESFTVATVGRFTRRKRIHVVPRIVAEAARKTGQAINLVIVGDGPLADLVAEEARRYSREVRVMILGFVERERLREIYWASDLLVVPARLEAFSITALEAMACGVPVIGFRESGISDVIEDGSTGFLVDSDEEAAEKAALLALDEDLRARMEHRAPLHIAQHFSWEKVGRNIVEIYRATMEAAAGSDKRYLLYRLWRWIMG
ncbi:hypothetical protein CF15_05670 [Pyrodictium occultum]|uniref:Glycosyl transferase n=1 Tax=Pyrodictium occultum TaxID=2309 RepID=A0A0V8RW31_PYROC|nr:glycosyltransferase family 4 protein [Pyrodictium occultum]KSW12241.1 hypothetical protein CF15_05670 [Pyrodictium occultum]